MTENSESKSKSPNDGSGVSVNNISQTSGLARRDFLRLQGASGVAALAFPPWEYVMAGPFTRADFEKLVPSDEMLSPDWVKSLTGGRF